MSPVNIAEKPIAAIIGRLTSTGDGIHMIANGYRKGHRIHSHMHREAQLLRIQNFGRKSLATIKDKLFEIDLWLGFTDEHLLEKIAEEKSAP